jgi:hypothetical protein
MWMNYDQAIEDQVRLGCSAWVKFFDRQGAPFTGSMVDFFTLHGELTGLMNDAGVVIFINHNGEVAGRGEGGGLR